jgi:hypothetical protein
MGALNSLDMRHYHSSRADRRFGGAARPVFALPTPPPSREPRSRTRTTRAICVLTPDVACNVLTTCSMDLDLTAEMIPNQQLLRYPILALGTDVGALEVP